MVMRMKYLLDTNVIIEVLRGNSEMITKIDKTLSAIMENNYEGNGRRKGILLL